MKTAFMFTSESITEGHPDKLCDQISDAIVGRLLRQDPFSTVVAECAISTGIVFLDVRFSTTANIDFPETARDILRRAGYVRNQFDVENCTVMTNLTRVSNPSRPPQDETELSDDALDRFPVSDQATCFGYACSDTPDLMPAPIWLAHRLARRLTAVRRDGTLPYLEPDGKTQVGVEYRDRRPVRIHSLAMTAFQQQPDIPTSRELAADLREHVIGPALQDSEIQPDEETRFFINPFGPVVGGGPALHSGLTGRKCAVDTYGEFARSSSSALSGKDPSRIDRVGNYAARYAAKNVVAAGLAERCEIHLSYSIGQAAPVSVQVDTFGTERISEDAILTRVRRHFDFRLAAIIGKFQLRRLPQRDDHGGFYERLAAYGHVGRDDLDLPWELTDRAELLRQD